MTGQPAVEGCDAPPGMLHWHHWIEWAKGGRTDVANALGICPFHHTRAHDPTYRMTARPGGKVSFHRRT